MQILARETTRPTPSMHHCCNLRPQTLMTSQEARQEALPYLFWPSGFVGQPLCMSIFNCTSRTKFGTALALLAGRKAPPRFSTAPKPDACPAVDRSPMVGRLWRPTALMADVVCRLAAEQPTSPVQKLGRSYPSPTGTTGREFFSARPYCSRKQQLLLLSLILSYNIGDDDQPQADDDLFTVATTPTSLRY